MGLSMPKAMSGSEKTDQRGKEEDAETKDRIWKNVARVFFLFLYMYHQKRLTL